MTENELEQLMRDRVVMFVDMWDSLTTKTHLFETEGAGDIEEASRMVTTHNAILLDEFNRIREGIVEQLGDAVADDPTSAAHIVAHLGDGAMIVFGDDFADEALCLSVAIVDKLEKQRQVLQTSISLAHGRVSVRLDPAVEGRPRRVVEIQGYPVDVAARLVTIAGPNQILMSRVFQRRCSRRAIEAGWVVVPDNEEGVFVRLPSSGLNVLPPGHASPTIAVGSPPTIPVYELARSSTATELRAQISNPREYLGQLIRLYLLVRDLTESEREWPRIRKDLWEQLVALQRSNVRDAHPLAAKFDGLVRELDPDAEDTVYARILRLFQESEELKRKRLIRVYLDRVGLAIRAFQEYVAENRVALLYAEPAAKRKVVPRGFDHLAEIERALHTLRDRLMDGFARRGRLDEEPLDLQQAKSLLRG